MACPLKDKDGNLDQQVLKDMVQVGGHVLEGGVKNFTDWQEAMRAKLGDVLNAGDLATVWFNLKADAYRQTGVPQTLTDTDAFLQSVTRRMGNVRAAADFANALIGPNGDTTIINKLIANDPKNPLTNNEYATLQQAVKDHMVKRKPGAKVTEGPLGIIQQAIDDAREEKSGKRNATGKAAKEPKPRQAKAKETKGQQGTEPKVKEQKTPLPRSEQDVFGQRVRRGLKDNADAFLNDLRGPDMRDVANAMGRRALTEDELNRLAELYDKYAPEGTTKRQTNIAVAQLNRAAKLVRDFGKGEEFSERYAAQPDTEQQPPPEEKDPYGYGLVEDRSERYKVQPDTDTYLRSALHEEPPLDKTDDELFDRHMASQLGSAEAADNFRSSLPQDLYDKLVAQGPKSLTPQETDEVTTAFAEAAVPRTGGTRSQLTQAMAPIAAEARASMKRAAEASKLETFEAAKGAIREQLASKLPEERMKTVDAAMDKLPDGDHKALSNLFNRFAPRGWVASNRLYTQNAMLSNPGSLAVALYSHLISAGVENTAAKAIADHLSGGLHASADPQMIAEAIARSLSQAKGLATGGRKGSTESWQYLTQGPTALATSGADSLHIPGSDFHQEFTVGNGGKVGNAVSAVGRFPGRMHGAVWHAVSVGLDEMMKMDAAHYAAIDEMEARNEKWTPEQVRTRARELYEHPTQKVLDNAVKLRQEQTFQNANKAAKVAKMLGPLATPVVPFATVASNIGGRALEHTPVGAVASVYGQVSSFARDNRLPLNSLSDFKAAVKAMPAMERAHLYKVAARGIIGAGLHVAGAMGYQAGIINPPQPSQGEYGSVNLGRNWEVGRVLGPYATPLFLGAYGMKNWDETDGDLKDRILGSLPNMGQIGESVSENPYASGLETVHNMFNTAPPGPGRPSWQAKATAAILGTQIPSVIRAAAGQFDPSHSMRNINTDQFAEYIWNALKRAIPGARETLPEFPYPEPATLLPIPRNTPAEGGVNPIEEWRQTRNSR